MIRRRQRSRRTRVGEIKHDRSPRLPEQRCLAVGLLLRRCRLGVGRRAARAPTTPRASSPACRRRRSSPLAGVHARARLAAARAHTSTRPGQSSTSDQLSQDPRLVGAERDLRRSRCCSTCSAARTSSTPTPSSPNATTYVLSGARAGRRQVAGPRQRCRRSALGRRDRPSCSARSTRC